MIGPVTGERLKKLHDISDDMAPTPMIRNTILDVLTSAENPLSFSEIRQKTARLLARKAVDGKTISEGLTRLRKDRLAEREIVEGKSVWSLTSRYYVSSLQSSLRKLITRGVFNDVGKILDNGMIDMTIPYTVFLIPPQDVGEVANASSEWAVMPAWSSRGGGIACTLFNDYLCLNESVREGLRMLIMWAYWVGLKGYARTTANDGIQQPNSHASRVFVAEGRSDTSRIAGEQAGLGLTALTKELLAKENLREFLSFAAEKEMIVRDLQRISGECLGHNIVARTFSDLTVDVGERFFDGLSSVGQRKTLERLLPRHMFAARDVWTQFIRILLEAIALSDEAVGYSDEISRISGNLEESKKRLEYYCGYLQSLAQLMMRRKVAALYMWGFSDIDAEAEKSFKFSDFDDWLADVKNGNADHRVWLFEEKTLRRVRRAYRSVMRGGQPPPQRIDKENWTLLDIYAYHPRGKDPKFWLDLIEALTSRNKPQNRQRRKQAVPSGIYSEFKKLERQTIIDMLDEDERKRKE